ncbi:MAG TPA: DUF4350 domain-containing protein [Burkholderiales bacterium]|nr:DUF4350 domain-containing protein [Burkholderiales bacterium]
MKLTNNRIIGLILTIIVIALGVWLYSSIELYDKTVDSGYEPEARRNRFLAAGLLMEQFGAKAIHSPVYTRTPTAGATLVLPTERKALSEARSAELLRWVKDGGHLVVVTWTLWREKDPEPDFLLDPLGARQIENVAPESESDEDDEAEDEEKIKQALKLKLRRSKPLEVAMPDNDGVLKVQFNPRFRLEDANGDADWRIADENGVHALGYSLGRGEVTVLTDYHFMENSQIGAFDNASLLYWLTNPKQGKEIWFVYDDDMPALWKWLVEYAWTALVAGSLLLICWLWAATRRLGPIIPPPSRERRSMIEHITASGRFLWRQKRVDTLYQAEVDAFMRQVRARHPQWAAMSIDELAREVAGLTGVAIEKVTSALNAALPRNEEQFMQDIYIIETLRTKL